MNTPTQPNLSTRPYPLGADKHCPACHCLSTAISLGAPLIEGPFPDWHTLHEENGSLIKALRRSNNGSRQLSIVIAFLAVLGGIEGVLLYLHW